MRPNTMTRRITDLRSLFALPALPRRLVLLALLLLAAAGTVACGGEEESAATESEPLPEVAVVTDTASYRPVGSELVATAAVEPSRRALLGTKILGRVERVPVEVGEKVAAGELLALLERRDLQAAVHQAEAGVASAEASLANARAQYERMRDLHERGSATEKSLEDATSAYRMAEAGVEQARAGVETAQVTLGYAEVRSPFDGWVVEKRTEMGDMVQPGAPLFTVEDLDPVKVIADVPEAQIVGFAPGDPVTVEVAATGLERPGTIERIVPSGSRRSRTFRVEIGMPNPEGRLKSGMFARVVLDEEGSEPALLVPQSAIVSRGQLDGVFVVEQGAEGGDRARLRWVRTGGTRTVDGTPHAEILSGLAEGERYVVDPPPGLVDGNPVRTTARRTAPVTTEEAPTPAPATEEEE